MENYFIVNINNIWNSLIDYFWYLKENPLRLIILILDLTIVIGLVYKFIKYSKRTRVWQLLKGIEENKKSIAYSLEFGTNDRTLTDEEINNILEKIIANLEKNGAEIRKWTTGDSP